MAGADVTVDKMVSFGVFYKPMQLGTDYNLTNTQNVTDSKGYGMIRLENDNDWADGEYLVYVRIVSGAMTEIADVWFRIGDDKW
jgi:hypothetical protein